MRRTGQQLRLGACLAEHTQTPTTPYGEPRGCHVDCRERWAPALKIGSDVPCDTQGQSLDLSLDTLLKAGKEMFAAPSTPAARRADPATAVLCIASCGRLLLRADRLAWWRRCQAALVVGMLSGTLGILANGVVLVAAMIESQARRTRFADSRWRSSQMRRCQKCLMHPEHSVPVK